MILDFTNSDIRESNSTILNGSYYGGLLIDSIEGKSEQNGTPNPNAPVEIKSVVGKNKLNVTASSKTVNGVTFTVNADKTITANGTASARAQFSIGTAKLQAGTYIVSHGFKAASSGATSFINYKDSNGSTVFVDLTGSSEKQFTLSEAVSVNATVEIRTEGTTVNNFVFKPMIRPVGTDDTYVPYGNLSVKTGGNQILNYDKWKTVGATYGTAVFENNGVTITVTGQDAYTNYNANVFPKIPVKEGETVTLSWEQDRNDILGMICIFGEGTASKMTSVDCRTANSLSYVVPSGVTFITFRFGVYTTGATIKYKNIMLNSGSVALPYEPYQCSTVNFTANLHGINGIKDRIIKKDGLWQIERRFKEVVFDGSTDESWTYAATNNSSKYRYQNKLLIGTIKNGVIAEVSNILSSHYVATTSNTSGTYGCNTGISVNSDGSIYIFNSNVCSNDVTAWCEWLAANPVTVVYELATPEYIILPPADQSAINSLLTFNSVTYIGTDSAVEPVINTTYGISPVGGYALLGATSGEAAKLSALQVVSFDAETGVLITKSEVQL